MQRRHPPKGDGDENDDRKPSALEKNNLSCGVESDKKVSSTEKPDDGRRDESDSSSDDGSGSDSDSSHSESSDGHKKAEADAKPGSPTERITTPTQMDVLFGRGKPYQTHPGNLRLHSVVKRHKDRYTNARRHEKLAIATEVVNLIKNGGLKPARFLKLASGGSYWVEQTTKRAIEKVGHALRGKPRSRRRGSGSEQSDSGRDVRPFAAVSNPDMAGIDDSDMFPAAERAERRGLLRQIAQLDTATLSNIVVQYTSGEPPGIAATTLPVSAGAFNPVISAGLTPTLLAGGLGTIAPLVGRPDFFIPTSAIGSLQREASVDPNLAAAALLQQSQIHQAANILSASGQTEQQRLLVAYLQQARQNNDVYPTSGLNRQPPNH